MATTAALADTASTGTPISSANNAARLFLIVDMRQSVITAPAGSIPARERLAQKP